MVETCVKYLELNLIGLREEYERIVNLHTNTHKENEPCLSKLKQEMLEIEEGIQLLKNL